MSWANLWMSVIHNSVKPNFLDRNSNYFLHNTTWNIALITSHFKYPSYYITFCLIFIYVISFVWVVWTYLIWQQLPSTRVIQEIHLHWSISLLAINHAWYSEMMANVLFVYTTNYFGNYFLCMYILPVVQLGLLTKTKLISCNSCSTKVHLLITWQFTCNRECHRQLWKCWEKLSKSLYMCVYIYVYLFWWVTCVLDIFFPHFLVFYFTSHIIAICLGLNVYAYSNEIRVIIRFMTIGIHKLSFFKRRLELIGELIKQIPELFLNHLIVNIHEIL